MEVKVYVDGLQRSICGVGKDTTCQDIVYALAHATGKRGRFVLVERSLRGKHERPLAPADPILLILQQKGEFWHDVQFVLLQTEQSPSAVTSFQHSLSPLPAESPFQRSFDGKGGTMRKSLSSCRGDFTLARDSKSHSSQNTTKVSISSFPVGVVENNFASDLIPPKPLKKAISNGQLNPPLVQQVLKVPVMPYGAEVPYNFNEGAPLTKTGSKKGSNRNGLMSKETQEKTTDKRKPLMQAIEQQGREIESLEQQEHQIDTEISAWESKLALLSQEIDIVEGCTKKQRQWEKSTSIEIAQLLNLSLENQLQQRSKEIDASKAEIDSLQFSITQYEANIRDGQIRYQELFREVEREEVRKVQQTNLSLKDERDRVAKELHQLVIVQDQQNRRLEENGLEAQRMDSTILARQLELDSLQSTLKKVNFAGFVTSSLPHASSSDTLSDFSLLKAENLRDGPQNHSVLATVKQENRSSPTPPARKSTPHQRIIVLKRNTMRDPQGMWV